MKVTYDDEFKLLYIYFQDPKPGIAHTNFKLGHNINMDVDKDYKIVGLEIFLPKGVHPQVNETLKKLAEGNSK